MQFDTAAYLRKATSRAKSDVANKLISMFLHEISRRVVANIGQGVTDPAYAREVVSVFGDKCAYCQRVLETDRSAVEHLEGMNRFRIGLHIQGNVVVACKWCNSAKRHEDQRPVLVLAQTGWESFLSHDSTKCTPNCKTCSYWKSIWPDSPNRITQLQATRDRIVAFKTTYVKSNDWSMRTRANIADRINVLYRTCQESANSQIKEAADTLFRELTQGQTALP